MLRGRLRRRILRTEDGMEKVGQEMRGRGGGTVRERDTEEGRGNEKGEDRR
jgi:hypothetical protein